KTEKQIADFMKAEVNKRKLGYAWDENVCPAVFTGPDTAQAHYKPLARKVQRGDVMNMDFGVKVNGYCSDLQRTFYILEKNEENAPPEVLKGFYTIIEAIQGAKNAIKPGMLGHQIDQIARDIILKNGYDEFPHGLGHQVGIYSHDGTALLGPKWEKYAEKPFKPIEEGMVFTIEPRLSVPKRGTVTIEEMIIVTKNGAEWLSTPQKNIILI
ncbi:MAG: aminopeptidase P family protein, partial [Ignavibacteriales bacterium]|nr:aminopeptidase P family protein [Ignavibacteriales bacterium]